MYNIRQSDDNKRTSDEFTFVGCFPADNPKYTIGMVVIRPHKLPATFCILVNLYTFGYKWHKQKKRRNVLSTLRLS